MADKYIEELKKRDKAMPMNRYFFLSEPFKGDDPLERCPVCKTIISTEWYKFCPLCGQRLDRDNYEF